MDTSLIAIATSTVITTLGLLFGYIQWRRDVKIKLGQLRETVSLELIRQRIKPYSEFFKHLETISSFHREELETNPSKIQDFLKMLQNAIYSETGLLASHETRQILVYMRVSCEEFLEGKISFQELRLRTWYLHVSLRSDLGIAQLTWPSEVERIRTDAANFDSNRWGSLVKSFPWDKVEQEKDFRGQKKSRKKTR